MRTASLIACAVLIVSAAVSQPTRFLWMPDGDGNLHLVDLEETAPVRALDPRTDVSLLLYTSNNPSNAQRIQIEDSYVPSTFSPNARTRFVIHGWMSNANKMDIFRAAYLKDTARQYNIILVDWSGPAATLYSSAKATSKEVGLYVAQVINYLVGKGVSLSNVQLAGHSLGAHAVGVAGNALGGALPMVTGMDPAAPLYGSASLADRLDESDAKFVQVVHTSAGTLGWADPMGHADFYPNNGYPIQPGCGVDLGNVCSHARSHDFFAESIASNTPFRGHSCSSWNDYSGGKCSSNPTADMGEHISTSSRGSFYLKTASSSPFALG